MPGSFVGFQVGLVFCLFGRHRCKSVTFPFPIALRFLRSVVSNKLC